MSVINMRGTPGVTYSAGSNRKYPADADGRIENVDHRDVRDLLLSGCSHAAVVAAPEPDPKEFHRAESHEAGDKLEK